MPWTSASHMSLERVDDSDGFISPVEQPVVSRFYFGLARQMVVDVELALRMLGTRRDGRARDR
jgi:hypothetical protein